MKISLLRCATLAAAMTTLVACDPQNPIEPGADGLLAVYVSGHLGSYRDCPEESFESRDTDGAQRAADEDIDADCDGDCGRLNCESARMTVVVRNTSDVDAEGIFVPGLFLLDWEGIEVVELPVTRVTGPDHAPFDGTLAVGAEIRLSIEFVGPINPVLLTGENPEDGAGEALWGGHGATIRLLVGAATHEDTGLDTPVLYSLPEVDT